MESWSILFFFVTGLLPLAWCPSGSSMCSRIYYSLLRLNDVLESVDLWDAEWVTGNLEGDHTLGVTHSHCLWSWVWGQGEVRGGSEMSTHRSQPSWPCCWGKFSLHWQVSWGWGGTRGGECSPRGLWAASASDLRASAVHPISVAFSRGFLDSWEEFIMLG